MMLFSFASRRLRFAHEEGISPFSASSLEECRLISTEFYYVPRRPFPPLERHLETKVNQRFDTYSNTFYVQQSSRITQNAYSVLSV